jgi:hypothetical protein
MSPATPRPRLQLLIEDAGEFKPLEDWIAWVQAKIHSQAEAINLMGRQVADARRELAATAAQLAETRVTPQSSGDPDELKHQMDNLDRRLNKILALLDTRLGGGQSEEGMAHHAYVEEYVTLVEQQVHALAVGIFRACSGVTPRDKAQFVAYVCDALFATAEVREQEFIEALPAELPDSVIRQARDTCAQARALRVKAAESRHQRWSFDFTPAAAIDDEWQQPWVGSVDDGIVAFVVAPAYLVDSDTLLSKQWVFTVPPTAAATQRSALQG